MEHSVEIGRPFKEVFAFVANPTNDPKWETELVSGQALGGPKSVDPKAAQIRKLLGPRFESTARVTELEPDKKIGVRGSSGPLPFEGTWTFEPIGAGTRVTFTGHIRASGLSKAVEPIFVRMLKQDAEANLGNLKNVLEEDRA